jgi:hypothetical protein
MLRQTILLLLLLITAFLSHTQTIDNLRTNEQVLSFIKTLDSSYGCVTIIRPKPILWYDDYIDSMNHFRGRPWEKADFDNNGLTDLLFNGFKTDILNSYSSRLSITILDMGNDNFRVKPLKLYNTQEHFAARTITINNKAYINTCRLVYRFREADTEFGTKFEPDTLTYAFDEFIELSKPGNYAIEGIRYCSETGFPLRQEYRIDIYGDSAILETGPVFGSDSMEHGHIAIARMDTATWSGIKAILQYMDCSNLKERYEAPWTCSITASLRIKYDGGKLKKISDYGLKGTYGLEVVHNLLANLKETLHWKVFKSTDFFSCDDD